MPRLACWSCGRQIYTTVPARGALRRGAAVSALRRQPARRASRQRAPEGASAARTPRTTPARPRASRSGGRAIAVRIDAAVAARRRPRRPATPAGRTDRAAVGPVRIAFLGFGLISGSVARALRASPDATGWDLAAWSPSGAGPTAADGRRRDRPGGGRRPDRGRRAPTSSSSAARRRRAWTCSTAWPGRGRARWHRTRWSRTWPAPRRPWSPAPTPSGRDTSAVTRWRASTPPATRRRRRRCSSIGRG